MEREIFKEIIGDMLEAIRLRIREKQLDVIQTTGTTLNPDKNDPSDFVQVAEDLFWLDQIDTRVVELKDTINENL